MLRFKQVAEQLQAAHGRGPAPAGAAGVREQRGSQRQAELKLQPGLQVAAVAKDCRSLPSARPRRCLQPSAPWVAEPVGLGSASGSRCRTRPDRPDQRLADISSL